MTAQSVVRGVIRSDSTERRLLGAEVTVGALARSARSDGAGQYLLADLPAGRHALLVRAIGHRPLTVTAELGPADTLEVDFELTAAAFELPVLEARAPTPFKSGKMEELERRRRMGFGRFLTRADLKGKEHLTLTDLLRRLVGIRFVPRPWRCGGGFAAAAGRGGSFGSGGDPIYCPSIPPQEFPLACYLAVYLDGVRIWAYDRPDPPNVNDYLVSSLEGVEVYRGPSETPIELQSTGVTCGALVLWTRTGESR